MWAARGTSLRVCRVVAREPSWDENQTRTVVRAILHARWRNMSTMAWAARYSQVFNIQHKFRGVQKIEQIYMTTSMWQSEIVLHYLPQDAHAHFFLSKHGVISNIYNGIMHISLTDTHFYTHDVTSCSSWSTLVKFKKKSRSNLRASMWAESASSTENQAKTDISRELLKRHMRFGLQLMPNFFRSLSP